MSAQDPMTSLQGVLAPGFPPSALQNAPVRSTEVCVAQRVADWVDRAVYITQPVTYTGKTTASLISNK